jgi:hypothetical protein
MKTLAAVFASMADAEHVARHLENLGIPSDEVHIVAGIVAGNDPARKNEYLEDAKKGETGTAEATVTGARFGGGIGILASLAALAIPGVGPIIAGGAMATVLTGLGIGAAAGGLLGAFKNLGISHQEAGLYEEAVRRGKVFIAVHVNEEMEAQVSQVMEEHGAQDIHREAESWRAGGWRHPDPDDSSIKWHEEPENVEIAPTRVRAYPFEKRG